METRFANTTFNSFAEAKAYADSHNGTVVLTKNYFDGRTYVIDEAYEDIDILDWMLRDYEEAGKILDYVTNSDDCRADIEAEFNGFVDMMDDEDAIVGFVIRRDNKTAISRSISEDEFAVIHEDGSHEVFSKQGARYDREGEGCYYELKVQL